MVDAESCTSLVLGLATVRSMEGDGGGAENKPTSQPPGGDGQAAGSDASPKPVFADAQPTREDQVQNAVKFLQHPKVRGSPVVYRRSFLEKKGLTKEEIDEAFRRAPDPPPNAASATGPASSPSSQEGQSGPTKNAPPQTYAHPVAVPQSSALVVPAMQKPGFRWTHVLLALSLFSGIGAGTAILIKNTLIPKFKSWILRIVAEEEDAKKASAKQSIEEIVAATAKAAAAAASDVAKLSQDILSFKTEERKYFDNFMHMLNVQVEEMKSIGNAVKKLKTGRGSSPPAMKPIDAPQFTTENKRSVSPPSSEDSEAPPHPKSYMDIMAMIQRGETPPGVKEINDQPPNPNQPLPRSQLVPRTKPWEARQHDNGYSQSEYRAQGSHADIMEDGVNSLSNGRPYSSTLANNSSEPWWQHKTVTISESQPGEVEERLPEVRHNWTPPPPPSVRKPEAAIAIRQLKSTEPKSHPNNDQFAATRAAENPEEMLQPIHDQTEVEEARTTEGPKLVELGSGSSNGTSSSSPNITEQQQIEV